MANSRIRVILDNSRIWKLLQFWFWTISKCKMWIMMNLNYQNCSKFSFGLFLRGGNSILPMLRPSSSEFPWLTVGNILETKLFWPLVGKAKMHLRVENKRARSSSGENKRAEGFSGKVEFGQKWAEEFSGWAEFGQKNFREHPSSGNAQACFEQNWSKFNVQYKESVLSLFITPRFTFSVPIR